MTDSRVGLATVAFILGVAGCDAPRKYALPAAGNADAASLGLDAPADGGEPRADTLAGDTPGIDAPLVTADGSPRDTAPIPPSDGPCGTPEDPRNCGICGRDCSKLPNVAAGTVTTCLAGSCVLPTTACVPGYAHCSSNGNDGCETSLARTETCGSCSTRCNAGDLCGASGTGFQCVSACSGATPDKCGNTCTDIRSDARNCGVCGKDCGALPNVRPGAPVACQGGHCVIPAASCVTGFGHCGSGPADNGCETNISVAQTCGCSACGSGQVCTASGGAYQCACPSNTCGSQCQTCTGSQYCDGVCKSKRSAGANCGSGSECQTGNCIDGYCCSQSSCPTCQDCGPTGSCQNIQIYGTDASAATTCTGTQACDGKGSCKKALGQPCGCSATLECPECASDTCHMAITPAICSCGDLGETCCPNHTCPGAVANAPLYCNLAADECYGCGSQGDVCCPSPQQPCLSGLSCTTGMCM